MRAPSLIVLVALAACAGSAPTPTCPAAPATDDGAWRAPLERMVGDWTFEGTVGGDGGERVTWEETCRWIPGSTLLACKTPGEVSTTIMGWEPHTGQYAHYGISGKGVARVVRGGPMEGETWRFSSEAERVVLTFTPTGFDFVAERPGADGTWAPALTGRYAKR